MASAGPTIADGEFTAVIYGLIRVGRFAEVVRVLDKAEQRNGRSRALLSLQGYCNYQLQDFVTAAECYEHLVALHPELHEYRLYHAQALHKAGLTSEALRIVAPLLDVPAFQSRALRLQAAAHYAQGDLSSARALVELQQSNAMEANAVASEDSSEVLDAEVNMGCLLYYEGQHAEACCKFASVMQVLGYCPELSYNMALCYYATKHYSLALQHLADIIARGMQQHPELSVGTNTEGLDARSVGNTLLLHRTALVEAFNLKAAIEYQLGNLQAAQDALTDMPPRDEEELDPVTLHNQALMNVDKRPSEGFEKLQFLMQHQNPCPPETFGNLLLLYCKHQYYDLAADVLADNTHLTYKLLTPYLYNFLDAMITCQTAPEEAFHKLDELLEVLTEQLRKLTIEVQEAKKNEDEEAITKTLSEYDETMEKYIPVFMAQAKIYWDMENYPMLEKMFHKSVEFCKDHDVWKLNVAHVMFMQEKYKEAIDFYEPIVKKHYDNLPQVSAIVLANLCVAYILTSHNEGAEDLMRKIEHEEDQLSYQEPDKKLYHLCIVNLVLGTLYCTKGNFDFGISRVIKSLNPYNKKLGTDTWYYAKRCFQSLLENMCKHVIMMRDPVIHECLQFFEHCEMYGRDIPAVIEQPLEEEKMHSGKNTVTYEARQLRALMYEIIGWNK